MDPSSMAWIDRCRNSNKYVLSLVLAALVDMTLSKRTITSFWMIWTIACIPAGSWYGVVVDDNDNDNDDDEVVDRLIDILFIFTPPPNPFPPGSSSSAPNSIVDITFGVFQCSPRTATTGCLEEDKLTVNGFKVIGVVIKDSPVQYRNRLPRLILVMVLTCWLWGLMMLVQVVQSYLYWLWTCHIQK